MNPRRTESGAILVEFALIAFALYLLLAALLSFGTMVQAAQVAQDAARLAARELALTPLPPAMTFEQALQATDDRIFDPEQLVVDLDALTLAGIGIDEHFATLPLVNRALRPVFVFDIVGGQRVMHFPGTVFALSQATGFNGGLSVAVPQIVRVNPNDPTSGEAIRWLPVVEEIRTDRLNPNSGPFSAVSLGPDRGLVALRINIPAVASALAAYNGPTTWPPDPNAGQPRVAGPLPTAAGSTAPVSPQASTGPGPLAGPQGLGELGALGVVVRPFRRVFVGQALFRREVFQ